MAKYIPETRQSLSTQRTAGRGQGRGRGRTKVPDIHPRVGREEKSKYHLRNLATKNYNEEDSTLNSSTSFESDSMDMDTPTTFSSLTEDINTQVKVRGRGRAKILFSTPVKEMNSPQNSPYNLRKKPTFIPEENLQVEVEHMKTTHGRSPKGKASKGQQESKKVGKKDSSPKHPNFEYFWRTESTFSQFHPACFTVKGENYVCTEQYMMSSKAKLFGDRENLQNIMESSDPKEMKKFGRQVGDFDPKIWSMCCRQFVQEGNRAKFSQNKHLLESLLGTNEKYLVEASPFDTIWGIGMGASNAKAFSPLQWRGSNWLGEALNQVKFEIQILYYLSLNQVEGRVYLDSVIAELFKIGLSESFEKMKCEIEISDEKCEKYLDVSKKSGKRTFLNFTGKIAKKTNAKKGESKTIFDFFKVSAIPQSNVNTGERVNVVPENSNDQNEISNNDDSLEISKGSDKSIECEVKSEQNSDDCVMKPAISNENNSEKVNNSESEIQELISKEEIPTLSDISIGNAVEQEYSQTSLIDFDNFENFSESQESGIFSQHNDLSIQDQFSDNGTSHSLIPHAKIIACEYIFADWAREKFLNRPDALTLFMASKLEELQNIPGYCVYKSNDQLIAPCISISHILTQLHSEFNEMKNLLLHKRDLIEKFSCAKSQPCRPQKYNLQNISGYSLAQDSDISLDDSLNTDDSIFNVASTKTTKKNSKSPKKKMFTSPEIENFTESKDAQIEDLKILSPVSSANDTDLGSCFEAKKETQDIHVEDMNTESIIPEICTDNSAQSNGTQFESLPKQSNSDSKRLSESSQDYFTPDSESPSPKEVKVANPLNVKKIKQKGRGRGRGKGRGKKKY